MRWRWLDRLLRRPEPSEADELERHRQKIADDWKEVRATSQTLADLITDVLKGDNGGTARHTR